MQKIGIILATVQAPRQTPPVRLPMSLLQGFPPVLPEHAHTLILGSMPGAASLSAGEYYAHPRNAFWPIMSALLAFDPALPYPQRVGQLRHHGFALWDVLGSCRRSGSLDTAIEASSMTPNPFAALLLEHPDLRRIFFNGSAAERIFRRHVLPGLQLPADCRLQRLPSTSPAHAGLSFTAKLDAWRELLQ